MPVLIRQDKWRLCRTKRGDRYYTLHKHRKDRTKEGRHYKGIWYEGNHWAYCQNYKCNNCNQLAPAELRGFMKLLEWER